MDRAKNWVILKFVQGGPTPKQARRAPSTINVQDVRHGIIVRLINWTGQNDRWRTRRPQALLVHYKIMKNGKHQLLTHNSERLVINHWTEKLLFNLYPKYSSQWYEMSSFAIGLRHWTPRYSAISRNHRNMLGIVFGNADKMHTKVSLLWLRKREQFSVVLFAFLETRREFYWRRNLTRDCFWDCYWGRAGQLLANLFLCP